MNYKFLTYIYIYIILANTSIINTLPIKNPRCEPPATLQQDGTCSCPAGMTLRKDPRGSSVCRCPEGTIRAGDRCLPGITAMYNQNITDDKALICEAYYNSTVNCSNAITCNAYYGSKAICPNATSCSAYYNGQAQCQSGCTAMYDGQCI